ncbi:MAG: alpha-2-macroglobulin, partial [Lentisphaeria bacterium]|nr:alpha-2-macroglobulin [Lentisphaeria bacterium]
MHMLHKMIRSAIVIPCVFSLALHAGLAEDRGAAQKLMKDGNWKEALAAYRKLTTRRRGDSPYLVCEDLDAGIQCIRRLRQEKEFGSFVEDTVKKQKRNWRLLQRAANAYQHSNHYGFIIDGEFQRGRHRGGGKYANVQERDRIRALQLMDQAGKRVRDEKNANAAAGFYLDYARLYIRNGNQSWRMQTLTDIETLPDVQEGHYHGGGSRNGAPVDRDGKAVLHSIPETFKSAVNDGERWRWLLDRAVEVFPNSADQTRTVLADFLHGQFGVQTMQQYGWFFRARDDEDGPRTYDLHTLGETETICQLAGGIQRFELPDEFAFVKIYEQIAKEGNSNWKRQAISKLATIFENRRQYEKAVRWWRRYKLLGKNEKKHGEDRIRQIVGNWGQFETVSSQPAGRAATVEFRFRNGRKVAFTAYQVLLDKLLADVRTHIRNNPKRLDWNKINIQNLGRRLVWENQKKYIGSKVAEWSLGLKPRP